MEFWTYRIERNKPDHRYATVVAAAAHLQYTNEPTTPSLPLTSVVNAEMKVRLVKEKWPSDQSA